MKTTFCLASVIVVLVVLTSLAHGADVTRAWNNQINGPARWEVLKEFNKEAVFDKETGLVWERSPSEFTYYWVDAHNECIIKSLGNRRGWRLPTIQELLSLVDPSIPRPGPTLPSNHPFTNVQPSTYWTATTDARDSSRAWLVNFFDGGMGVWDKKNDAGVGARVWCVRGGSGVEAQ